MLRHAARRRGDVSPMQEPDPPADLDPLTVARLVAVAGLPPASPELAVRLAAGANAAVAAVAAHARHSLFDTEPLDFLAELERLAEPR